MALILRQGLTARADRRGRRLVGTFGISKALSKLLYEVTPIDPLAFGGSTLLLMAVAGLACWIPAGGARPASIR